MLPSYITSPEDVLISYVDDFVIAAQINLKVIQFLVDALKLSLFLDKTLITSLKKVELEN